MGEPRRKGKTRSSSTVHPGGTSVSIWAEFRSKFQLPRTLLGTVGHQRDTFSESCMGMMNKLEVSPTVNRSHKVNFRNTTFNGDYAVRFRPGYSDKCASWKIPTRTRIARRYRLRIFTPKLATQRLSSWVLFANKEVRAPFTSNSSELIMSSNHLCML